MILTLVRVRVTPPGVLLPPHRALRGDVLERFCRSIHLVSQRDTDGTVTTVMRVMLKEGAGQLIGSSDLAAAARLNRVTVIHHLRRLEQAGLVEHTAHKYRLAVSSFAHVVRQMREDTDRLLDEAERIAEQIDTDYLGDGFITGSSDVSILLDRAPEEEKKIRLNSARAGKKQLNSKSEKKK